MDKIEQLYNLYLSKNIITSKTSLEKFRAANQEQQNKLYELGKNKNLFQTTDFNKFQTAWGGSMSEEPVKKKVPSSSVGQNQDTMGSTASQQQVEGILSDLQFDKETYTPQPTGPEIARSNFVEASSKPSAPQAPSQFDPAKFVAPEQPLVPDSQPIDLAKTQTTRGFNTYYNTLDKAVNAGLVKDEKEFNQKFPDMSDLSFEEGKTQVDFIDKYDSLSDEIKQKIEPAIIRENGVVTGINPNLISKENIQFLQETAMDDDISGKSSEEQAQLVLKNIVPQQKIDYLIEEKKLYSLQESIVNSKKEIDRLSNSGLIDKANLLVDKYNSELQQYKSLAKNLNEKSVIINSLDIAKDNFGMWAPVSTAASAVERFGSSVIMAIPSMAATGVNLILNLPGVPGEVSEMGSDIEKSLMQIGMDMNKTWKGVIPTDSDDTIGNFIGDVSGQIGFVVGSAVLGGAPAALAAGYTMSMSEMYEEATQNGISHDDAMYLSKIYGGVSAPLEMLGAGGLIKKATGNALRNQIIKTVIKEGAEGFTKEIAEQAVKLSFKPVIKETLKEGAEEGLQEGAQYLLSKGLAEAYNEYIKEDTDAEFKKTRMLREEGEAGFAGITKAFWGELGENIALGAVGGMVGGVGINVMQGNVYTGSNYKAIENMLLDPKQMAKISDQLTAYRKNGTIKTDEELQLTKERIGVVQEAAAHVDRATKAMPESFGIEQQKRTFALVTEKLSAEKQIEGMMPILAETKKAQIEEIDNQIRDIASGKITEADLIAQKKTTVDATEIVASEEQAAPQSGVDVIDLAIDENPTPTDDIAYIERRRQGKDNKIENITYNSGVFEGSFLDNYEFIAEGSESRVYRSKDGTHVIKISEPYNSKDENLFNARITNNLLREIIGNSELEVVGYYEHNGVKNPIYKQSFVEGKILSEKEVADYLKTIKGVIEIDSKFYYKYDGKLYAISDFSDNVIQDKSGNIVPIDLDIYEVENKEINAKYDAEVTALTSQATEEVAVEAAKQEVAKPILSKNIEVKSSEGKKGLVPISELEDFIGEDRLGEAEMPTSRKTIDKLKEDISKNGFKEPIVIVYDKSSGEGEASIIEGNHRIIAAKELGFTEIPVTFEKGTIRTNESRVKDKMFPLNRKNIGKIEDARGVKGTDLGLTVRQPTEEDFVKEPEKVADVVKVRKSDDFIDDAEHIVSLNGKEVGRIYYDRSSKAWRDPNFDKSKFSPDSFERIYGDILGETKQESIEKLVKRYKESLPKEETPAEESKVVQFTKDTILNEFLNKLNTLNPIKRNAIDNKTFIYGDKASLEFNRYDKGDRNEVSLDSMYSLEKGKGFGKDAMVDITKSADELGTTLTLIAKPFGREGLDKKGLIDFYKKNGFEVDETYLKDLDFASEKEAIDYVLENESEALPMVRLPKTTDKVADVKPAVSTLKDAKEPGTRIITKAKEILFKGTQSKTKDGKKFSVHNIKQGRFAALDIKLAMDYKGDKPLKQFSIPAGTTIDVVKLAPEDSKKGITTAREIETAAIDASDAQVVKLLTYDSRGGVSEQYIIKDKSILDSSKDVTDSQLKSKLASLKVKMPTQMKRIFDKVKNIKDITYIEQQDIVDQIMSDQADMAQVSESIMQELVELEGKGKISQKQSNAIVSRMSKLDKLNERQVARFIDYASKIFNDANYKFKVDAVAAKLKKAKLNTPRRLGMNRAGGIVKRLFTMDMSLVPKEVFDKYAELVELMASSSSIIEINKDIDEIAKTAQEILSVVEVQNGKLQTLAQVYQDNKSDKLTYSQNLDKMLVDEIINIKDKEILSKYKSLIDKKPAKKKTAAEIEEEKKELIKGILSERKLETRVFATRAETDLAIQTKKLATKGNIDLLSVAQLKTLSKVISNINNGLVDRNTFMLRNRLNANNSIQPVYDATLKGKIGVITNFFHLLKPKAKSARFGSEGMSPTTSAVRFGIGFNIDAELGNPETRELWENLLERLAIGENLDDTKVNSIVTQADKVIDKIYKSFFRRENRLVESKAKMFIYKLGLEFKSNPDSDQVKSPEAYLKKTINNGKLDKRTKKMLSDILNDKNLFVDGVLDLDKLYNSFNKYEKEFIELVGKTNQEASEYAMFDAGIIQDKPITLLNDYVHHIVIKDDVVVSGDTAAKMADKISSSMTPSTRAKHLTDREDVVTPLNFDLYNSLVTGVKKTYLTYYMTEPIMTSRLVLDGLKAKMIEDGTFEDNKDIFQALNEKVEEGINNLLFYNIASNTEIDEIANQISNEAYRYMLASDQKLFAETAGAISYIAINKLNTFADGVKAMNKITMGEFAAIATNAKTIHLTKFLPKNVLYASRLVESSSSKSGTASKKIKSKAGDYTKLFYNQTFKRAKNAVGAINDFTITTADKLMNLPLWYGSFRSEFKKVSGQELDKNKFVANDLEYVQKYENAIEAARRHADEVITDATSVKGKFSGKLAGKDFDRIKTSPIVQAITWYNEFMAGFMQGETNALIKGVRASRGSGRKGMSRADGRRLVAAILARSISYNVVMAATAGGLFYAIYKALSDLEDDKYEKELSAETLAEGTKKAAISAASGRVGNVFKIPINLAGEYVNREYFYDGPEDEYENLTYLPRPDKMQWETTSLYDYLPALAGKYGVSIKTAQEGFKVYQEEQSLNEKETSGMKYSKLMELEAKKANIPYKRLALGVSILGQMGYIPFGKNVTKIAKKEAYRDK